MNLQYSGRPGRCAAAGAEAHRADPLPAAGRARAGAWSGDQRSQEQPEPAVPVCRAGELGDGGARLAGLSRPDGVKKAPINDRALYRIWPDFKVHRLTNKSISTVKADAARNAFSAIGEEIVWAVIDSGIDGEHPHFSRSTVTSMFPSP